MEVKNRRFVFVFGTAMIGFSLWYIIMHKGNDKDNLKATGHISEESFDKYAILSRKTVPQMNKNNRSKCPTSKYFPQVNV